MLQVPPSSPNKYGQITLRIKSGEDRADGRDRDSESQHNRDADQGERGGGEGGGAAGGRPQGGGRVEGQARGGEGEVRE